jgi:solute carrier family 25 (mitochondrial folate transporter), member 32
MKQKKNHFFLYPNFSFLETQNDSALARTHHRTIRSTIMHTWTHEGIAGFYRGLGTNLVRVLPGTCVTFVVYENLAWLLKRAAVRREKRRAMGEGT